MDPTLKHAVSEKNVDQHDRFNCLDLNRITRCKYFIGAEGGTLVRHVSIAGAIGFLLGYDQGVLGVERR